MSDELKVIANNPTFGDYFNFALFYVSLEYFVYFQGVLRKYCRTFGIPKTFLLCDLPFDYQIGRISSFSYAGLGKRQ